MLAEALGHFRSVSFCADGMWLGCCFVYWTTSKMRFEFGLTITRWPLTKGGAAPVLSCEDGHIFRNNLAGHGHTCEVSARTRFKRTPIRCPPPKKG
jgi:hypothetical protein